MAFNVPIVSHVLHDEDHVIRSKALEQLLNGPSGKIVRNDIRTTSLMATAWQTPSTDGDHNFQNSC